MTSRVWDDESQAVHAPILVATRNDALDGIVDATPADRRRDLVFLQVRARLPSERLQQAGFLHGGIVCMLAHSAPSRLSLTQHVARFLTPHPLPRTERHA